MTATPEDTLRPHDFDGIQEYDNRLPNWWLWTFYLAILFSVGYWIHFHVLGTGDLPREQFAKEMAAAEENLQERLSKMEISNDSLLAMAAEPGIVAKGREVFEQNCVTCHRADAGGNVGPNLTDGYWLHGSQPVDIYNTVTHGVIEKAMPTWGPVLGPTKIQQVVAYVLSIKNTNVPNGKAPQGTPEQ